MVLNCLTSTWLAGYQKYARTWDAIRKIEVLRPGEIHVPDREVQLGRRISLQKMVVMCFFMFFHVFSFLHVLHQGLTPPT